MAKNINFTLQSSHQTYTTKFNFSCSDIDSCLNYFFILIGRRVAIIVWGEKDSGHVSETIKTLEESGVAYDVFSREEANRRCPQLRIPPDFICF